MGQVKLYIDIGLSRYFIFCLAGIIGTIPLPIESIDILLVYILLIYQRFASAVYATL
ncbi:hypothetical protein F5884DRAFT_807788 [Xylogone sp. PMI_703]|nr:hypothetical protein F5884DRAFT_807788 [Xylogone sp. PMI_703]